MKESKVAEKKRVRGDISVPGDKSISHRAVILGGISKGETLIKGFSHCADCQSTVNALLNLGVEIKEHSKEEISVFGQGSRGLTPPTGIIDAGNSGTTIRLLSGVLAGQDFTSVITGDQYLLKRPMRRIILPLRQMGATVSSPDDNHPPLTIKGGKLRAISYTSAISSAQVKSCILLAGLYAQGRTTIQEPFLSRDHTERMFKYLGIPIEVNGTKVSIEGPFTPKAKPITIPGDISSAAFFIVACLLLEGSELRVRNVCLNPTRTGIIDVLKMMGANISTENIREICGEPTGDIVVRSSKLRGTRIDADMVPRLIDEIPILALAATQAEGITEISGAQELRVKESDRIATVVSELSRMGASIKEKEDGMIIQGKKGLKGTSVNSFADHRMAMTLVIAGLIAHGETSVVNTECIDVSFPQFMDILREITE